MRPNNDDDDDDDDDHRTYNAQTVVEARAVARWTDSSIVLATGQLTIAYDTLTGLPETSTRNRSVCHRLKAV